jgi:hypothetical protein
MRPLASLLEPLDLLGPVRVLDAPALVAQAREDNLQTP